MKYPYQLCRARDVRHELRPACQKAGDGFCNKDYTNKWHDTLFCVLPWRFLDCSKCPRHVEQLYMATYAKIKESETIEDENLPTKTELQHRHGMCAQTILTVVLNNRSLVQHMARACLRIPQKPTGTAAVQKVPANLLRATFVECSCARFLMSNMCTAPLLHVSIYYPPVSGNSGIA